MWQILADLRNNLKKAGSDAASETGSAKKKKKKELNTWDELAMFGWILGVLAAILILGFWVGLAVYLPVFIYFHGRESLKWTVIVSAGGWGCIFLIFHLLLRVRLFEGFILRLLDFEPRRQGRA